MPLELLFARAPLDSSTLGFGRCAPAVKVLLYYTLPLLSSLLPPDGLPLYLLPPFLELLEGGSPSVDFGYNDDTDCVMGIFLFIN